MKKFAVILMLLGVGLFSLALVGCGEKADTPAGGGGTDVTTPEGSGEAAGGEEEAAGGEEAPAGGEEEAAGGEEAPAAP